MTKRPITMALVLLLLLLTSMVSAQTTGLESVFSNSSFGVFGNELDAALTVQEAGNRPGFSDLTNRIVFGGLANLNFPVEADQTFVSGFGNPLWIGYFSPGEMPFSLFLAGFYDGAAGNLASGTDVTNETKPVVDGTTTTNVAWVSQTTEVDYTGNRLLDRLDKRAQFITSLGGMNLGVGVGFRLDDASPQGDNVDLTQTVYYDAALPGAEPQAEQDYTYTSSSTSVDRETMIDVDVPVFLRTGDMGHTVQLGVGFSTNRVASTFTESYSATSQSVLADTVTEEDTVTRETAEIEAGLNYMLTMPAFLGQHAQNEFSAGVAVDATFRSGERSESLTEQDRTWAGGGAASVVGERNEESTTDTIEGQMDLGFGVNAAHSFYFDPNPMVRFGLVPGIGVGVDLNKAPYLITERVVIDREDNDADGEFTSAVDRVITTTTTYTNQAINPLTGALGNDVSSTVIRTTASLAGSAVVAPENWVFAVTLGSRPRAVMTSTATTTRTAVTAETETEVDGAGDTVSTEVTQAGESTEVTVWNHAMTVDAAHRIGLNMVLADSVRLDVALNLSSGTNILDFRNLVIQGIIPLP